MKRIFIKNVGPIKEADVSLNKFNFFIGPQSCGKSTIAKVLSTCTWIEKEVATTWDEKVFSTTKDFLDRMIAFHKMETYFDSNPEIHYETDVIKIDLEKEILNISLKNKESYTRHKTCYIPSERNVVTLPELQGFEFKHTNLRRFLFDWFEAREYYTITNKIDVLNLGVKYYYDPSESFYKDRIEHVNGKTYRMPLGSASSGLQSVIPLMIMIAYYSDKYFDTFTQKNKTSFDEDAKLYEIRQMLMEEYVLKSAFSNYDSKQRSKFIKEAKEKLLKEDPIVINFFKKYLSEYRRMSRPVRTEFIIEEPEQNLFPDTQTSIIEYLISLCSKERENGFTITTHSPYILNSLNLFFKRFDSEVKDKVSVNFNDVSAYAISDGYLRDIKLLNAHLVDPEYLSAPIDHIYNEYDNYDKN